MTASPISPSSPSPASSRTATRTAAGQSRAVRGVRPVTLTGRARITQAPRRAAATGPARVFTPAFKLSDKPAAMVLRAIRTGSLVLRDDIVRATGLSAATVNRQVSALLEAGVVRERADQAAAGAVGRPRLPLEIDPEGPLALGIHIGFRVSTITVHDLAARVVGAIKIATPASGDPDETLAAVAASASRFLARWDGRTIVGAGVALAGRVDERGRVDHPRLGWTAAPVGETLSVALGLPVTVGKHVEAMVNAELQLASQAEAQGSTLYVYGRETVGIAVALHGAVHTPRTGPGSIGHLPTRGTVVLDPRRTGRLEDAVTDTAIVEAALAQGLTVVDEPVQTVADVLRLAEAGNEVALEIITERGRILGEAVALVADILNPDRIILGGQAFTDYPSILPTVAGAIRAASAVADRQLRVTGAGGRVQQQAAGAVALDGIYSDPLGALSRAIA